MVCTICAFLEFCYLAQHNIHSEKSIEQLQDALDRFHQYCKVFQTTGVWPTSFSLPRQHASVHYQMLIWEFGTPNGLCLSITESSQNEPLNEMLLINQRLTKLAATCVDFTERRIPKGTCLIMAYCALHKQFFHLVLRSLGTKLWFDTVADAEDRQDGSDNEFVNCARTRIQRLDAKAGSQHNDDNSDGAVEGLKVCGYVVMASTIRKYSSTSGKTILVPGCSERFQEHPRDFRVFKALRVARVLLNLVDMRFFSQSNLE